MVDSIEMEGDDGLGGYVEEDGKGISSGLVMVDLERRDSQRKSQY
jgi:hypothetical protein